MRQGLVARSTEARAPLLFGAILRQHHIRDSFAAAPASDRINASMLRLLYCCIQFAFTAVAFNVVIHQHSCDMSKRMFGSAPPRVLTEDP